MKTRKRFIIISGAVILVALALSALAAGLTQAQSCSDPYEPNDSFGQAWSLKKVPTTLQSYICQLTDVDYFRFQANADDTIYLGLYDLPADYDLCLYGPSGTAPPTLIACSSNHGTTPEVIEEKATMNGMHYAYVYGVEGDYDDSHAYILSINEAPDLIVTDVWKEASPQGERIYYQIRNIGATEAISGHVTALSIDGQQEITHTVSATLAAGERLNEFYTAAWCTGQEDVVQVCTDFQGDVPESDEANNCITETWKCDAVPPVITSGPVVSQVLQTSAAVTWTTDEDSDSAVAFGQHAGAYEGQETNAGLVTQHAILLTGLQPATVYHYAVSSTDASSNTVTSKEGFFETLPGPYGIPPSLGTPTVTQIEGGREIYRITVPVSNTTDVERVEFYLDDRLIGIDYSGEPLPEKPHDLDAVPAGASQAALPLVVEFVIELDPPRLDLTPDTFFDQPHTVTARAFNRNHLSSGKSVSFNPHSERPRCHLEVWWPPPDYTVYVSGGVVPPNTTLPITVTAYFLEWEFSWFEGGGRLPPGAPGGLYSEWKVPADRVELYTTGSLIPDQISEPSPTDPFTHYFSWNIGGLTVGAHDYKLRMVSEDGGHCDFVRNIHVSRGAPDLHLTRSVTQTANYFSVTLTLENKGTLPAKVSQIQDNVRGFQPVDAEMLGFEMNYTVASEYCRLSGHSDVQIDLYSAGGGGPISLAPGEHIDVTYLAVPILYHDSDEFEYGIGIYDDVVVCDPAGTCRRFERPVSLAALAEMLERAHAASDYLIVTYPARLFIYSPSSDVNTLLAKMAELAQLKGGILGYVSAKDAETVRSIILEWGHAMKGSDGVAGHYLDNGYLLIVGEAEIIGSWEVYRGQDFGTVHYSDLVYGNTAGIYVDPELAVGRIIGDEAADLLVPIEASINVYRDVSGYRFTKASALLVSGRGDGYVEFEQEVDEISHLLSELGSHFDAEVVDVKKQRIVEDVEGLNMTWVFTTEIAATNGRDVLYYSDHCNSNVWSGVIGVGGFPIDFFEHKPFAFACCCQAGRYEDEDDVGIAETFMRYGTPAYIGATENSGHHTNLTACPWFFDRWADREESIGQSFRKLKIDLRGDHQDYWAVEYNLYGDPKYGTLPVYAAHTAAVHDAQAVATEPITSVEVIVPHYVVSTTLAGEHIVRIPGGDTLIEVGEPLVPIFFTEVPYPAGVRVQDVTLTARSGLENATGLVIPVATEAWDTESASPAASGGGGEWWPDPTQVFDWHVREHPDGSSTLVIHIYPFYYNAQTTQATFFENYSFDITVVSSTVEIAALETGAQAYVPGDEVLINLWLRNWGDAQNVIVNAVVRAEGSDEVADGLLLRSLKGVTGTVLFSPRWDSTGFEPGYYSVEVEIRDSTGNVLDTEMKRFRLGVCSGQIASFTATPGFFDIGDTISTSLTFSNTGTIPITGTAVIQIQDEMGETVETFRHAVANLAPEDAVSFDDSWDTSGAGEGSYTIIGYVLYDSKATDPDVVVVGTETYLYLPLVARSFSP